MDTLKEILDIAFDVMLVLNVIAYVKTDKLKWLVWATLFASLG